MTQKTGKLEKRQTIIKDHFEEYAASWHKKLKVHPYAVRFRVISELLDGLRKNTVVDIGCGTGDYSTLFDSKTSQYIGYDISPQMIKQCRMLHPNFTFEVGSAEAISAANCSIDLVLSVAVFEYYEDPTNQANELYRILAIGGNAIVCVPNKSNITRIIFAQIDKWLLLPIGALLRGLGRNKSEPETNEIPPVKVFKHTQFSAREMDGYSSRAGFRCMEHRYVATHFLPTTFGWLRRLDIRISEALSGKRWLNGLTKYASTILICRLEK